MTLRRSAYILVGMSAARKKSKRRFRKRLAMVFHASREGIAAALREGLTQGMVRRDVNPAEAAGFLIATLEGYVSLAKNAQDAKVMKAGIRNIVDWLRSLRPPGNRRSG